MKKERMCLHVDNGTAIQLPNKSRSFDSSARIVPVILSKIHEVARGAGCVVVVAYFPSSVWLQQQAHSNAQRDSKKEALSVCVAS